jgi:hypothetical protein
MRILFANTSRPKSIASKLREALARMGIRVPLRRSLEVAARIYGYRDWNQLCTTVGTAAPSPSDLQLPPEDVAERRQYQVRALAEALQIGIPATTAIIDDIKPTCSRIPERPSVPGNSEWLLQAIRTGDLNRALERAALGIASVGQVHFHRMFSFDAGFFYRHPLQTDGLAEHVILHSGGGLAFRAPWFEQDYVWNCRDREGSANEIERICHSNQDDIGAWATALVGMGAYADEAIGRDGRETAKRVLEHLGRLNLDLIASLAVFDSPKFSTWYNLTAFQGLEDPVSWFYGTHPAFLDYILHSGKDDEKREIKTFLERHYGDSPSAFADYAGDSERLRRRAVRFLNKARQSSAVANAFDAFGTSRLWLSDADQSIPYDQDDFDRRFAWLDERLHRDAVVGVGHPPKAESTSPAIN